LNNCNTIKVQFNNISKYKHITKMNEEYLRNELKDLERQFIGGEKGKIAKNVGVVRNTVRRAFNGGVVSLRTLIKIKNEAEKQIELNNELLNGEPQGVNLELAAKLGLSK
jgi:hypothetical protein